jgi:SEL1 protein
LYFLFLFRKFFKSIAERGDQSFFLQEAANAYEQDDRVSVFLKYSMASEQGFEVAQNNLAYLLDEGQILIIFHYIDTSGQSGEVM